MTLVIATHLPHSYAELLDEVHRGRPKPQALSALALITLGDWARVSDADAASATHIVGVHNGCIVSAYQATSYRRTATGRVRWAGGPADDFAGHIGDRVPGGAWGQGQARPLRTITLAPKAHPRGLGVLGAVWELLTADGPAADEALLARVHLTATAGRVTIKVPAGTSVLVDQVPA
ncbi:MAG: hypothetical protein L0H96_09465 [Humibacillus sp.]|nr:hypothetical protein [Humibacillus sp.]MDN5777126.1 hypothetical protein [Humibacillus sp.]MDN5803999.1 hypothetical protein [Microlunatus sp.]